MLISLQKPVLSPDGTATEKRILPQGHAVSKERTLSPGQTITPKRTLSQEQTITKERLSRQGSSLASPSFRFARLPWRATPCLYGFSCPRDSAPPFSGKTEWWWVFRYGVGCRSARKPLFRLKKRPPRNGTAFVKF